MALATQCPHCFTTFRVAADQLKLRGGIVRCGACQSVFDGNAHLIDLDKLAAEKAASEAAAAAAAGSPPPVETAAAAPAAPETPEALAVPDAPPAPAPDDDALPVYTLDFDRTFDPLGILPKATSPDENTVPVADVPVEPTPEPTARAHVWRTGAARPAEPAADAAPPAAAPEPDAEPEPAPAAPESAVPASAADAAADAPPAVDTPSVSVPAAPPPAPAFRPAPVPASAYAPQGRIEPSFDLPPDEELVAQPLPDFEPEPAFDPAPRIEPPTEVPTKVPNESLAEPLAGPFTEPVRAPAPQPAPAPSATPDPGSFPAALPLRASAGVDVNAAPAPSLPAKSARGKAVEARTRRSKLTPTKIDAPKLRVPVDADADEPEFVKRSRRQERSSRTRRILMGVGAAVLLLALAAQLVLNFRNGLAARYPGAKPVLGAACAVLGCRVDLPADVDNLAIETGELNPLGADTYVLNTLLRNGGSLVQAWPSIELELIDDDNKPVLRRVLAPAEYLPRGTPAAAGFGAHSEQPVKLHFALAGLKPSGYHTFVFYP